MKENQNLLIRTQWLQYLELVRVRESDLPPDQKREMQRAFYAGIGQTLVLLHQDVASMTEAQAEAALESLLKQVGEFCHNELNKN
ncbi:MAG: hypothetical protein WKF87_22550 [Chryseolinea sp.]